MNGRQSATSNYKSVTRQPRLLALKWIERERERIRIDPDQIFSFHSFWSDFVKRTFVAFRVSNAIFISKFKSIYWHSKYRWIGCATVNKPVVPDARGPGFESWLRQYFMGIKIICCYLLKGVKIKQKEAGNGQF